MGAHYVRVSYWLNESPFLLLCVGQEAHSSLGFYGSLSRCPVATHVALGPQLMQSHTWGRISVSLSVVFSAAVFPSLTLSQPKQLYQESESNLFFFHPKERILFEDETLPPNFCPRYRGCTHHLLTLE